MMLDINIDQMRRGFWRNLPVAAFVGVLIVLRALGGDHPRVLGRQGRRRAGGAPRATSNTKALAAALHRHVFPFDGAGVILLLAMVAAIALTLRGRKDTKTNDPSVAVQTKASDRIRLVKGRAHAQGPRNELTLAHT